MDVCACGFGDESVRIDEIVERTARGVTSINRLLLADPRVSLIRPSPDRWSVVEYAGHVRDVLLTIRDRLVIGLVEDDPGFKPLYREERIELGLYRADTAAPVAAELAAAATMFQRLFAAIETRSLDRQVQYGFPGPTSRSLAWMGRQAVHEIEHHLADIEENLHLLTA